MGSDLFAKTVWAFMFGTPQELKYRGVEGGGGVIYQFVDGAKVDFEAGFKSYELHAAEFPFKGSRQIWQS